MDQGRVPKAPSLTKEILDVMAPRGGRISFYLEMWLPVGSQCPVDTALLMYISATLIGFSGIK